MNQLSVSSHIFAVVQSEYLTINLMSLKSDVTNEVNKIVEDEETNVIDAIIAVSGAVLVNKVIMVSKAFEAVKLP